MRHSVLFSCLVLAALSLPAGEALAGGPKKGHAGDAASEYPIAYAERPLTLPRMTLAPELGFSVMRVNGGTGTDTKVGMEIGASFGITKDLEVGVTFAPLVFAPSFEYGEPRFGATYRFLSGQFELGARLDMYVYHPKGVSAGVLLRPAVPMLLHIGKMMRLDVVPTIDIAAGDGAVALAGGLSSTGVKSAAVGMRIPIAFAFDIIEPLHVGANTGFHITNFEHAGDTAAIPLGFSVGYAISMKNKPLVDIDPFFRWPAFATPGAGTGRDKVNAGLFEVGIAARGYISF